MSDPAATAIADFAFGQARYYLGEHVAAAANLERTHAIYPVAMRGGDRIRFSADVPACTLSYQAVTYWSLGLADKAARAAREAVAEARSVNDPVALCISLCGPNSIVLLNMGYLNEAERCIEELIDHSEKHSLTPYHAFGLCAKGRLMAGCGDPVEAQRLLRLGIQRSRDVAYYLFDAFFQGELASVLGDAGRIDEGLGRNRRCAALCGGVGSRHGASPRYCASKVSFSLGVTAWRRMPRKNGSCGRATWHTVRMHCHGSCALP